MSLNQISMVGKAIKNHRAGMFLLVKQTRMELQVQV